MTWRDCYGWPLSLPKMTIHSVVYPGRGGCGRSENWRFWPPGRRVPSFRSGRSAASSVASSVHCVKMFLRRSRLAEDPGKCDPGPADLPVNKSKAAGLKSSKELSNFSGVRHFWQYIVSEMQTWQMAATCLYHGIRKIMELKARRSIVQRTIAFTLRLDFMCHDRLPVI